MSNPGDVCEGCKKRWKVQDKSPLILMKAPRTTSNKKYVVALCTWCDGPAYSQAINAEAQGRLED